MLVHQFSNLLATEAGRKRRIRWRRHHGRSAGTALTRRRDRAPAASRTAKNLTYAAAPLATKADRRAEKEGGVSRHQRAEDGEGIIQRGGSHLLHPQIRPEEPKSGDGKPYSPDLAGI
jgi:hypothetical protein